MLALLRDRKSGEIAAYDIPPPELRPGGILVRTHYSAISTGTERAAQSSQSLLRKATARPDLVKQVVEYARQNGLQAAYQKVRSQLDTMTTVGYSCAGVVIGVGEGVSEFRPGDRVACAGDSAAHSEINFVPRNLAVHIPAQVPTAEASLTTIGAIAMQSLRQANVSVGETVAIIGAGLVGVLTTQIARAAGCRVIAIDLSPERVRAAEELGAHLALAADDPALLFSVNGFSRHGVDAAIVTAATPSAEPAELAAQLLRDRGRIIIVGAVGMGVSRTNMYMKELTLALSRSYGPGRYDPQYEERGVDYPIGYVRWTERRNMEGFLNLLATKNIDISRLVEHRYRVEQAPRAFADLKSGMYTAILEYNVASTAVPARPRPAVHVRQPRIEGQVRIGCIGAGSFARTTIFPQLKSLDGVHLESVATISGSSAASAQRAFKFAYSEQPSELLDSPNVDAAFILTRHDTHATYAAAALRAGKPVFVEKPLAAYREQLAALREVYATEAEMGRAPFVMVDFNRRLAPLTEKLREFLADRREPMLVHVRVNAGHIPREHWVHEDGGRIVGELCHFVDWARAVVGASIHTVAAAGLPDGAQYRSDNVAVTMTFADGSIANLLYVANGDRSIPKEFFEVFCQGGIARLHDFSVLELARNGKVQKFQSAHDKGHRRALQLTIEAIRSGNASPIPFEELAEVAETTFCIQQALATRDVIRLGDARAAVAASVRPPHTPLTAA